MASLIGFGKPLLPQILKYRASFGRVRFLKMATIWHPLMLPKLSGEFEAASPGRLLSNHLSIGLAKAKGQRHSTGCENDEVVKNGLDSQLLACFFSLTFVYLSVCQQVQRPVIVASRVKLPRQITRRYTNKARVAMPRPVCLFGNAQQQSFGDPRLKKEQDCNLE